MNATTPIIRMHATGAPSVLQPATATLDQPGPGQVRLRQQAIGVNYLDTMMRDGRFPAALPAVPGFGYLKVDTTVYQRFRAAYVSGPVHVAAEPTTDITPRPLRGGVVRTYHDHRMATATALLGLRVPGVRVEDVATTGKTLPDFVAMWQRMLGTPA